MTSPNTKSRDLSQCLKNALSVNDKHENSHNLDNVHVEKSQEKMNGHDHIHGEGESSYEETNSDAHTQDYSPEIDDSDNDLNYKQSGSPDGSIFGDSELSDWEEDISQSAMNFRRPFMHPTERDQQAFDPSDLHVGVLSDKMEVWHFVEEGQFDDADDL